MLRALMLMMMPLIPMLGARAQDPVASYVPPDSVLAAAKRAGEAALRRTTRLFGDTTPLAFTLAADFRRVFRNRDTLSTERFPARITVADSSGAPRTFELEINPRGNYRMLRTSCDFPPIKLNLTDGTARGTPFQGQEGIKLGTHCRAGNRDYEEYVIREYLVYRMYTLLTDASLRARLARVTYVDASAPGRPVTTWALLIEDEDDAAKRVGGRIAPIRRARFADVDSAQLALIALFEYAVGNSDWSLYALHNIRLIQMPQLTYIPMAYDFDWSGIVSARYAKPKPDLPIKTVQDRIYTGPCIPPSALAQAIAKFKERRAEIEGLYVPREGLDAKYVQWARGYIADFYRTIDDPGRVKNAILRTCLAEG